MIRIRALPVLAALLIVGCAEGYRYGVSLDISNAPPPPRFVFRERPVYVETYGSVVVVDPGDYDCDMFQYGSSWYVYSGGYWYRSRSYNGPYAVISFESVPSRIYGVPESRWRHHPHGGPPGQMKKRGRVTS